MTTDNTTEILKSEIDWDDFSFRFGKKDKKDELSSSIELYGMIESPIVVKEKEKYRIFSGFNRLEVSKNNQNCFYVIIINEVNEDFFRKEVGKKLYHDRIGISGKIKLCLIYREFFSKDSDALKETAKAIGGIPIDFLPGTVNFSKVASLSEEFSDYLDEKDIAFKVLRNFLSISSSSQEILIPLMIQWNPGKNNFKKLVDVILDVEQKGEMQNVLDLLKGIAGKGEESSFDELYASLSAMRYPSYAEMIVEKDRLLKLLHIPSIQFILPDFFEGDEIVLQARIKRSENPEDVFEKINGLDRDAVTRLLQLL